MFFISSLGHLIWPHVKSIHKVFYKLLSNLKFNMTNDSLITSELDKKSFLTFILWGSYISAPWVPHSEHLVIYVCRTWILASLYLTLGIVTDTTTTIVYFICKLEHTLECRYAVDIDCICSLCKINATWQLDHEWINEVLWPLDNTCHFG